MKQITSYAKFLEALKMLDPDLKITLKSVICWTTKTKHGRVPGIQSLMAMCELFGCPAEEFFDFIPPDFLDGVAVEDQEVIRAWPEWLARTVGNRQKPNILPEAEVPEMYYEEGRRFGRHFVTEVLDADHIIDFRRKA
jgi:hypothetical protein